MPRKATKICKAKGCSNQGTTSGYCRVCYLRNWKKIQEKQKKKAAESLNRYVEHIMKKNPDNYVDTVKHDLKHAGRFQEKADSFMGDPDYVDVMEEIDAGQQAERIIGSLKIDDSF